LPRRLDPETAAKSNVPLLGGGRMTEPEFRYRLNRDVCGTEKLTEGLNAFIGETLKLETAIVDKVNAYRAATTKA
jgi:transaldolase